MKFICLTLEDFGDRWAEAVELCAAMGFDAFLKLWDVEPTAGDVISDACRRCGLEFIAPVPSFEGMPAFEAIDGSTALACPNYAWDGLDERVEADVAYWAARADSLYIKGGLDWYGYPNRPMIDGDPWKRKRDGLLWTAGQEYQDRFARDVGGKPASSVKDDPHGTTLSWYNGLVDDYFHQTFLKAYYADVANVYMFQTMDMYRGEYAFLLGRVMMDLRMYKVLQCVENAAGFSVWQVAFDGYGAYTTALEFAMYRRLMPIRSVVSGQYAQGLVQQSTAMRAVLDGHDAVIVAPIWYTAAKPWRGDTLALWREDDFRDQVRESIEEAKAA